MALIHYKGLGVEQNLTKTIDLCSSLVGNSLHSRLYRQFEPPKPNYRWHLGKHPEAGLLLGDIIMGYKLPVFTTSTAGQSKDVNVMVRHLRLVGCLSNIS